LRAEEEKPMESRGRTQKRKKVLQSRRRERKTARTSFPRNLSGITSLKGFHGKKGKGGGLCKVRLYEGGETKKSKMRKKARLRRPRGIHSTMKA